MLDGGGAGSACINTSQPLSTIDDFTLLRKGVAMETNVMPESVVILFYKELPTDNDALTEEES